MRINMCMICFCFRFVLLVYLDILRILKKKKNPFIPYCKNYELNDYDNNAQKNTTEQSILSHIIHFWLAGFMFIHEWNHSYQHFF